MSLQEDLQQKHLARKRKFFPTPEAAKIADLEVQTAILREQVKTLEAEVDALIAIVNPNRGEQEKLQRIINAVSEITGISENDILADRRQPSFVEARHLVFYAAKHHTLMSFSAIGKRMKRDHTTIMYACDALDERMKTDAALAALVARVFARLS